MAEKLKNPANEFESVQSDARMATLEQKISESLAGMDSRLQSMQDGFTKMGEFSSSVNRFLSLLDTGNDEAESGTVQGESGGRSIRRLLHIDNAKTGVDAFIRTITRDWSEHDDVKQKINQDYFARLHDQRTLQFIAMLPKVSELTPDQIKDIVIATRQPVPAAK